MTKFRDTQAAFLSHDRDGMDCGQDAQVNTGAALGFIGLPVNPATVALPGGDSERSPATLDILHTHSTQIGPVTCNVTFGRIVARKPVSTGAG